MPRIGNLRERQHQPVWDTLFRAYGTADPGIAARTTMFGSTNLGNLAKTNLTVPGQLASDQTYVVLSLRCFMHFDGTNRRAAYVGCAAQLYFTFVLSDRPQFQAPAWYFPQGGGIWGFDSGSSIFSNGVPSQDAILKLGKAIVIPVRQSIGVTAEFFKIGTYDVLDTLNTNRAASDQSSLIFMIDGIRTRDVL